MIRILFFLILAAVAAAVLAWYSAQSLPDWYSPGDVKTDSQQQIADQIQQQGVRNFMQSKFADISQGQLVLDEIEFKALMQASLQATPNGRNLLSVSDAFHVEFTDGRAEIGVIVNLDKVADQDIELREQVNKLLQALPLLDKSRVFLAVSGRPLAVNGNLAFAADISVKVGTVPISNNFLKQLGLPGFGVDAVSLPLKYVSLTSVATSKEQISLGILPRL